MNIERLNCTYEVEGSDRGKTTWYRYLNKSDRLFFQTSPLFFLTRLKWIGDHTKVRRVKEKCRRPVFTSYKQCRTRKFCVMVCMNSNWQKYTKKTCLPSESLLYKNSTISSKHNFRNLESDPVNLQGRRLISSNILGRQKQHTKSLSEFKTWLFAFCCMATISIICMWEYWNFY